MTKETHLAGVPKLTVAVTSPAPRAALVGLLYDVDQTGKAKLISRAAYAVTRSGTITFDMYPQDWRLAPGHRFGFLVAGDDGDWYLAPHSEQTISVTSASVSLPILAAPRTANLGPQEVHAGDARPEVVHDPGRDDHREHGAVRPRVTR